MGKIYEALEKATQDRHGPEEKEKSRRGPASEQRGSHQRVLGHAQGQAEEANGELVVLGRPGSIIAEHFRFLRSRICRPLRGDNPRTVLITSALQGEGKTFVASNLAATIAQGLDEHVLLVDADLRNPRLHSIFNLSDENKGLSTHLQDNEPLQNLMHKTTIPKLTVLPAGFSSQKPAELISSSRMKKFIIEVRYRYPDRYVIFDSSPIELSPETAHVANEVEGIFLVLRRAQTPRETAKSTIEKFKKEQFLGVILNGYNRAAKYYKYKKKGYYNYCYPYGQNKLNEKESEHASS